MNVNVKSGTREKRKREENNERQKAETAQRKNDRLKVKDHFKLKQKENTVLHSFCKTESAERYHDSTLSELQRLDRKHPARASSLQIGATRQSPANVSNCNQDKSL